MELSIEKEGLAERKVLIGLLAVQIPFLLVALALPPETALLVGIGLGGAILFSILPVYPQLVFPLLVVTSALDLSGHLVEDIGLFANFSIPLTWFHLAGSAAIIFCAANVLFNKRISFPRIDVTPPLILMLALYGISIAYTPEKIEATIMLVRLITLAALIFVTLYVVNGKGTVTLILVSLILWQVSLSVLGIVQTLTERYFLPATFVSAVGANVPRAAGTFHNSNDFGTLLMVGIVLVGSLLANLRMALWKRFGLLLAFVVLWAGLIVSFSRSNWLAAVVGLFCVAFFSRKTRLLFVAALVLGVIVLSITAISSNFADIVFGRFTSIYKTITEFESAVNVSGTARIQFVQGAMAMFVNHPFLGIGGRGFPALFDQYRPVDFPSWLPTRECHTLQALILAELGIVGFALAFWFMVAVIRAGIKGVRTIEDHYLKAVMVGLLSVFIAYQVSMVFTAAFEDNYLWIMIGLLFAVKRIGESRAA